MREWLDDEPKGWRYWKFLLICVIWMLAYGFAVGEMMVDYYYQNKSLPGLLVHSIPFLSQDIFSERHEMILNLYTYPWWLMFLIMVRQVFSEEIRFRWAALFPATKILGNSIITILIAVLASFFFGWRHGHLLKEGLIFVPIQGVIGLALSLIYLKCGGLHKHNWKALWSSFLAHLTFNLTLSIPVIAFFYIQDKHPDWLNNLDKQMEPFSR